MKKSLLLFCPAFFGSLGLLWVHSSWTEPRNVPVAAPPSAGAIGCAPGAEAETSPDASGKFVRLLPGWGHHAYAIRTGSDSAQMYFNQGLTMYYSYHAREASASFREAARFDSACAMTYFGLALAMGPSYNFYFQYKPHATLPGVLEKMNRFAGTATPKEQALIAAMNRRYDPADSADRQRPALNAAYAAALRALVAQYPDDIDIKALYIDAVMLMHPWTFWYNNGRPRAWTGELVGYCQDILRANPRHPGALHYYIHITEASRTPEVALPAADSLIRLFPGVAHMVHMSSHEYERTGYYAQGVAANEKADRSLVVYDSLAKGLFPMVHVPHYYAVDAYCALSGAMYEKAMAKSLTLRRSVQPNKEHFYPQFQYMFPLLAMVRMGKWEAILQDQSDIRPEWIYAGILNDFARGMAAAKTGQSARAARHLEDLRRKMEEPKLRERFAPHTSTPYECAVVAENILLANLHFEQKQDKEAFAAIRKAIAAEDSLLYSEPALWMLPARQYYGAFLMQRGQPAAAEAVYRADLSWNPGNGWSLLGLYQALKAQGKNRELPALKTKYLYSFSDADPLPDRSAY
ncbi:MAG TPA: hypothetical protein VHK69_10875 [Chitinophagaceae bacterium]|nr:hypothetical protein [Chitinophagaceae bacterium]